MKKAHKNTKLLTYVVMSFTILTGVLLYLLLPRYIDKKLIKEATVGYNEKYNYNYGTVTYGNFFDKREVKPVIDNPVDTKKIGVYDVKYIFEENGNKIEFHQKVTVIDNKKPDIFIDASDINVCKNGNFENAKISAIDEYEGDITDRIKTEIKDDNLYIRVSDRSGNIAEEVIKGVSYDKKPPVITLNGNKTLSIKLNGTYKESGAKAIDGCDGEVNVTITGSVNTKKTGQYKITYTAVDSNGNKAQEIRTVNVYSSTPKATNVKIPSGAKIIYLTFDDGPSKYTSKLLDVLKKYNVKATFFVTGYGSDAMIKREYDEGHTVGLHSYTHEYCKIYKTVDGFFDDLYKVQNRVKRITGHTSYLMRFAGGSSNTVSRGCDGGTKIMSKLVKEVGKRGFTYFDWNVVSGDAGWTTNTNKVYNYVVTKLKGNYSIVLQHDSKGYSVDAVEAIIKFGLANGFTFKKLDASSPTAHHGVNN